MKIWKFASGLLVASAFAWMVRAAGEEQALTWDSEMKQVEAKLGDTEIHISFTASNASASEIVIQEVKPSCGCTIVSLPGKPWKIAPGASGTLEAKVDLRGKSGVLVKGLTVNSSVGVKNLTFRVQLPNAPAVNSDRNSNLRRVVNQLTAGANRQAVFQGECASCHVQPAIGKTGAALFDASCGICHAAAHRATMVPELAGLPNGGNRDYWRQWISMGKEGTLMPGFSKAVGGPLTDEQITSLVEHALTLDSSKAQGIEKTLPPGKASGQDGKATSTGTGPQAAGDGLEVYRSTNGQAGHQVVETQQFLVPVGEPIVVKGLEFKPGVSSLSPEQKRIVQEVFNSIEEITENTVNDTNAERVAAFKKIEFEVRGYPDAPGAKAAEPIPQERANSVVDFLAYLGTPSWRLKAKGIGPGSGAADGKFDGRVVFVRIR